MPDPLLFCDEEELTALYGWIDDVEDLSREKRNITRDFADGVMAAELISNFLPRIVELHNYQPSASRKGKTSNWNTINKKVLKKLKINIPNNVIEAIVMGVSGVVEVVLIHIRNAILRITKPDGWQKTTREDAEDDYDEPEVIVRAPTEVSEKELLLGKSSGGKKKKKAGGRARREAIRGEEGVALPDINAKSKTKKKRSAAAGN